MKRLAIVIPAYKAMFLATALDSIAMQTCKDFTLYVGDDCSSEPIGDIVKQYQNKIELVYHRFDSNLGGKDLVGQWERCIAMSRDEPYIWLFSDDDVMDPNCVEQLFKQIENTKYSYNLYHFNSYRIDEEGKIEMYRRVYPSVISAYEFYKGKKSGKYDSFVIENVFSRQIYEQSGGFLNFDLAWGSDVTTWCKFCGDRGMCSISGALVGWRRSTLNITPNKSKKTAERKLMADCKSLCWAYNYFSNETDIWWVNRTSFIKSMCHYKKKVSNACLKEASILFFDIHGHQRERLLITILLVLPQKIRKFFIDLW